jgi:L-alanine-DL-glutamate epimerase-like enolase superfamily enzyme
MQLTERHYTSVTIQTEDGRTGVAISQSRGAPLAEIGTALLVPLLEGAPADAPRARWEDMYRGTIAIGRVGLALRAISLLDVALWDLLGKRSGLPIATLLGAYRQAAPVTYVAGYPSHCGDVDSVLGAAVAAAASGHRVIKVARTAELDLTQEMLRRLDAELPPGVKVQVDANWVWRSVSEALAEIEMWPASRLLWVEDPFVPEHEHLIAQLRAASDLPIAAGDELADGAQAVRLLDSGALVALRLDVMTIGGITAALELIALARQRAIPVSFHVSPETSVHLACGVPGVLDVETFDRAGNPFDPGFSLIAGGPAFDGGTCTPSSGPGLGFSIAARDDGSPSRRQTELDPVRPL